MDFQDTTTDSREELVSTIVEAIKKIKTELSEIEGQISETEKVVDREQQRNADIAAELRILQENIDTVPRSDIRAKYDEALDARHRISTMSGQLEKFQSNRDHLQRQQQLLTQIATSIQGVQLLGDGGDDPADTGLTNKQINIVRIVQAQEEERQRLARQMHDGPAQSLTNFILQAEICQRLFDRNPERAGEELENLKSVASVTFQKVRDFIFDLRPMMLDDLGVIPTVKKYADSYKQKTDIDTKIEIFGDEQHRIETHREVLLFRGIQELMAHARDYANATELLVRLDMTDYIIKVLVKDNGESLNVDAAFSKDAKEEDLPPRAREIVTLREKIELVGGTLTATSEEGEGTEVRLELPESGN